MPHVITITGPSGAGKSTTLRYLLNEKKKYFDPVMVPKFTDRPHHNDDQDEVICVEEVPSYCDLKYMQYRACYGLALNTLYQHITAGQSPIVILNDVRAVEDVRNVFGGIVKSLFIFRESPTMERFIEITKEKGLAEKEIGQRFQKAQTLYRIYIENIHIFDHVIINSGTPAQLMHLVKLIVDSLQQRQNWPLVGRDEK
jgi:guanylate kinase